MSASRSRRTPHFGGVRSRREGDLDRSPWSCRSPSLTALGRPSKMDSFQARQGIVHHECLLHGNRERRPGWDALIISQMSSRPTIRPRHQGGSMHFGFDHCDIEPAHGCQKCLETVSLDGLDLELIPETRRTPELCSIAMRGNPHAFQSVTDNLKTDELCLIAVTHDGRCISSVPDDKITLDLCILAVRRTGFALYHIPDHFRNAEVCAIAVAAAGMALAYVPEHLRLREICEAAVRQDGGALEYVPLELRSVAMCRIACKNSYEADRHVPICCPSCNAAWLPANLKPIWKRPN